jgi:hypothetical protein
MINALRQYSINLGFDPDFWQKEENDIKIFL